MTDEKYYKAVSIANDKWIFRQLSRYKTLIFMVDLLDELQRLVIDKSMGKEVDHPLQLFGTLDVAKIMDMNYLVVEFPSLNKALEFWKKYDLEQYDETFYFGLYYNGEFIQHNT